jgi:hypothetical protein
VRDLHAAFTLAGAPTLLASLWPVQSLTARDLVVLFFESWRSGRAGGASEALAQATRTFLGKTDVAHQHPRFWASFVIVGYGGVLGEPTTGGAVDAHFEALTTEGGDLYHLIKFGSSAIVSMSSDWDGKKMASIISRLHSDGREDWRVSSREVGAGKISVNGNRIYAIGYTTEANPTPVVRLIESGGRIRWQVSYPEFRGYSLEDVTNTHDGILAVAVPRFADTDQVSPQSHPVAFILEIGSSGNVERKIPFEADGTRSVIGRAAFILRWGSSTIVAVNHGMNMKTNYFEKNIAGFPPVCWENASTTLFQFDGDELTLSGKQTIAAFKTTAVNVWAGSVYVGGEAFDNCSMSGRAAVHKVSYPSTHEIFWNDPDLFKGSVQGIAPTSDGLWIAVGYQRALGVHMVRSGWTPAAGYEKRWGEEATIVREAALMKLSSNGAVISRKTLSAGLSVFLIGIEANPNETSPIVYGTLGGMPALSRWLN